MCADHTMGKWDARFFQLCRLIAGWSEDQRRKVGAVIVGPENELIATGYNGLPRGVNSDVAIRHSPEENEKYYWFEHAERNSIFNAARIGVRTAGCRLYTSVFPCADCARAIIQSGIIQVNTFARPPIDVKFDRSFDVSHTMLKEAKVELKIFSDETQSGRSIT